MSLTERALSLTDGDVVKAEALKAAIRGSIETGNAQKAAGWSFVPKRGLTNPRQEAMAELLMKGATPDKASD